MVAGRADWIAVRGIDRWLGGVHLQGHHTPWRRDERRGRLVADQAAATTETAKTVQ
jgi:hypothetical protein